MSTRQVPVYIFVDLSRSEHEERAKEKILASVCASDLVSEGTSVWIAVDDDSAHLAEGSSDPSWAVHSGRPAAEVANLAFAGAARSGADLLILDGSSMPDTPSLRALGRCLETDPHIGFAVPRVEGF